LHTIAACMLELNTWVTLMLNGKDITTPVPVSDCIKTNLALCNAIMCLCC